MVKCVIERGGTSGSQARGVGSVRATARPDNDAYFIGKAAKLVGLNAKTIRYYEEVGIIPKSRRETSEFSRGPGYRVYTAADVERLRFVKIARHLGLPLKDIKKLLQAVEDGCCGKAGPQGLEFISAKVAEVEKQMRDLRLLRDRLLELNTGVQSLEGARRRQKTCPSSDNPMMCVIGKSGKRNPKERRRGEWRPTASRG